MDKSLLLNGVLRLYGTVGDADPEFGFTDRQVAEALAEHGQGDLSVYLNSGGGIATQGMSIYSQLKAHLGHVTVEIDGIAASAGSLIAMAGDKIAMRVGTTMMIHDPAAVTVGTARAHRDSAAALDKLADGYAAVYAARAGMTPAEARAIMLQTTWFSADDAIERKFATDKIEAASRAPAAFDYSIYGNAPAAVMKYTRKPTEPAFSVAAHSARMRISQDNLGI